MEVTSEGPRIWLIAGPTASGKSALALRLALAIGGEIVGADALQVYRDLAILTARPSGEDEARAPHHLFGVAEAADGWSAGRWLTAARAALADIAARGTPAVVVGGTGLYLRALTEGIADIPATPAAVRQESRALFDRVGEDEFRRRLARDDPASEARVARGDRQRLLRAGEVFAATGQALSDWQAETGGGLAPGSWRALVLEPPRAQLYRRCDARLAAMVEAGVLAEVRALIDRRLDPGLPAMKAVGLRPFADFLKGKASLADALLRAQLETRHYAKRQLTWLRGQASNWPRITAADAQGQWEALSNLAGGGALTSPWPEVPPSACA
jgi:tRNA dimethylallyltransferase